MEDSPQRGLGTPDFLRWAEFSCWTALVLAPVIWWLRGPSASNDQVVIWTALVVIAAVSAVILRAPVLVRRLRSRRQRLMNSSRPASSESDVGDAELVRQFVALSYGRNDTWRANQWLQVPTRQNPDDVWIIQEIISEVKPDVIVETGTFRGGSAMIWAMILREVNHRGKVLTIDVEGRISAELMPPVFRERVQTIVGDSIDPAVMSLVQQETRGKRVMVILDSDHSKQHVTAELKAYSTMVSVGSYIVVQDTMINGHPVLPEFGPGPMEAVNEFLGSTDEFIIDHSRERLLHTMHPKGYLKRVRREPRGQGQRV